METEVQRGEVISSSQSGSRAHALHHYSLSSFFLFFFLKCNVSIPFSYFFKFLFIYLFIFGCVGSSFLCEGFLQPWQVGAPPHRDARASSLSRTLLLQSTGSRRAGSVVVAHGSSCSVARGILPDQGSVPVSPASAGRFSTTAPPGKPPSFFLNDPI